MAELPSFSLTGGYSSGFASADFGDADDSRPSGSYNESLGGNDAIQGIIQASMGRHLRESLATTPLPLSAHTNNWRKHLREMMIKQNETVLAFLARPAACLMLSMLAYWPMLPPLKLLLLASDVSVAAPEL